jgi:hypothetical protein
MGGQGFDAPLSIYPSGMCDECDSSRCGCSEAVPRLVGREFEVVTLETCPYTAGLANFNLQEDNMIP